MKNILLCLCAGFALAWSQTPVRPGQAAPSLGDVSVEAEGMGRNADEAMLNARRAAVEKGIGTVIHSETEIKNFMVNKDMILTRTLGAVRSAEKISESKGPDGVITLKIRAVVSASQIHDDLAALRVLLETMDRPRVMVLIKETNMGSASPASMAETEIIRYLREKDFDLVDPATVEELRKKEKVMQALEGNDATQAAVGADAGAEVLITGTAASQKAEGVAGLMAGMQSCQADVSVRVIVCATAKIIAAKNEHAALPHINAETGGNLAIGKAAKKIMDEYLFEKIVAAWQDVANNGIPLSVTVSGVKSFQISNAVIKGLEASSSGVVKVTKRKWNQASGVLELEVKYKGNCEGFCQSADGSALSSGGKILVTENSANSARMKVGQ